MQRWIGICSLLLFSGWGCSQSLIDDKSNPIPLADIPATAMEAAQKALPDVKFDHAWKFKHNGEDAFEIRGKSAKGKIFEAEVTASGKVIELE